MVVRTSTAAALLSLLSTTHALVRPDDVVSCLWFDSTYISVFLWYGILTYAQGETPCPGMELMERLPL